jgi:hypothetical protein
MIPLNVTDWNNHGDRTKWCSTAWWTNENIYLQGSSLGRTEVMVGQAVTIAVGIQGVALPGAGGDSTDVIQNVQAWACYPYTATPGKTPGKTSKKLLLFSMNPSNPAFVNPAFVGPRTIQGFSTLGGEYQSIKDDAYFLASLSPTWTPAAEDLVPPNTTTHCCLVANSTGMAFQASVGTLVKKDDSNLGTVIDICNVPQQGQCNISIVPVSVKGHKRAGFLVQEFGFLAASSSAGPTQAVLEVTPVSQQGQVDPAVLGALKTGPYRDLPLQPASSGPKGLSLSKNTYKFEGWLATLIRDAETILAESSTRLQLSFPPDGVQPMLLEIEVDPTLAPGSVYAFDITQADATGNRGGIRVGAIVVP